MPSFVSTGVLGVLARQRLVTKLTFKGLSIQQLSHKIFDATGYNMNPGNPGNPASARGPNFPCRTRVFLCSTSRQQVFITSVIYDVYLRILCQMYVR